MTPEMTLSLPDILQGRLAGVNYHAHAPHLFELTANTVDFDKRQTYSRSVLVISGPPGGGKDTLADALVAHSDSFTRFKTATTRAPRPEEIDNSQYLHISKAEFKKVKAQGGFIETNPHKTDNGKIHLYGSPVDEIYRAWSEEKIPIMRVDPNGAKGLRLKWELGQPPFSETNFLYVYVSPPDESQLRDRLIARDLLNGKTAEEANLRVDNRWEQVQADLAELSHAHYLIINHDGRLEDTKEAVLQVLGVLA